MAKKKNVEMYDRALKLYRQTLTTEEKQKEFADLTEDKQKVKVDGWRNRNKAIIVGDLLNDINKLNKDELNKLKENLQTYLTKIDDAVKNLKVKEIDVKKKEKETLMKRVEQIDNDIAKMESEI